jgi:hypothetical protein
LLNNAFRLLGLPAAFEQVSGGTPDVGIALVVCVVPPLSFVAHRRWTYH